MTTGSYGVDGHRVEVSAVLAGCFWVCACGNGSEPTFPTEEAASRDAQRHIREAAGFSANPTTQESDVMALLAKLAQSHRRSDPEDLQEFGSFIQIMDLLNELDRRGWLTTTHDNRGDDRLLSARGIGVTPAGEAALRKAMQSAVDLVVGNEPEAALQGSLLRAFGDLQAKRAGRARFMDRLYDRVDGSRALAVETAALGLELGWANSLTVEVVRYLLDEGLVERTSWGGPVSLTHAGVVEVEQLKQEPESPTEHFPPMSVVIVQGDNHGQIQSGARESTQSMQTGTDTALLREFVDQLRQALRDSGSRDASLAEASLTVIESELEQGEVRSPLVERLLPPLRDLAIGIASSGAYEGLHAAIAALPPF